MKEKEEQKLADILMLVHNKMPPVLMLIPPVKLLEYHGLITGPKLWRRETDGPKSKKDGQSLGPILLLLLPGSACHCLVGPLRSKIYACSSARVKEVGRWIFREWLGASFVGVVLQS